MRRDSIMRWAMILRIWLMGTRSPGIAAGAGELAMRRLRGGRSGAAGAAEQADLLQKCGDVLLGDASAQVRCPDLSQIDVVLAGDFADQRRRASMVVFFMAEVVKPGRLPGFRPRAAAAGQASLERLPFLRERRGSGRRAWQQHPRRRRKSCRLRCSPGRWRLRRP